MSGSRTIHYGVASSLALHAAALFGLPDLVDTARRAPSLPPQLVARLMEPEPPRAQPQTARPAKKKPPQALEAPAAVPAPPPIAAVEPHASASAAPAVEMPESLSRDQYRVQLIGEARRHKRYPPLARENNWQGDVRVGVAVSASGRASVSLKGSSGYDVLDQQALEMFMQAARAVPVPLTLRGREFSLEVRAVYGLD